MKKPASKKKKKRGSRKRTQAEPQPQAATGAEAPAPKPEARETDKTEDRKPVVAPAAKREADKRPEKKKEGKKSIGGYVSIAVQFLRESRVELKKVKWPTRKELLASTAMVIFLVLVAAVFLGLIDFGLIKIIKTVVG